MREPPSESVLGAAYGRIGRLDVHIVNHPIAKTKRCACNLRGLTSGDCSGLTVQHSAKAFHYLK